jgi:hypothetical protein
MNQALYAHMNNKRKMKKKRFEASPDKNYQDPISTNKAGHGGTSLSSQQHGTYK